MEINSHLHPVVRREYSLPTPPLRDAADHALMRVSHRQSFCPFIGNPRFGKTCALNYIAAELRETFPTALVVKVVAISLRSHSPTTFHDYLFTSFGGQIQPGHTKGYQALLRAANRLVVQAHDARADQIVFLIDEFGRLTVDEMVCLADLSNVLVDRKMRNTTIAFGSCEMEAQISALQLTGRRDLIGRYLSGVVDFEGISSAEQLGEVMLAYDNPDIAEFPSGSQWSLTRFFWPTAWEAGHRLAHFYKDAWQAFSKAAGRSQVQIGAEYWSSAIEHVLTATMNFHLPTPSVGTEIWNEGVERSGFVDTLDVTYDPGKATAAKRKKAEKKPNDASASSSGDAQ